jgi:hypothetical protein
MRVRTSTLALFLAASCCITSPAMASIIFGNPITQTKLVSGGSVNVIGVRAFKCSGGSDWREINTILYDEGDWAGFTLPNNQSYCDMEVDIKWTLSGPVEHEPVTGFDELHTTSQGEAFEIQLDSDFTTAVLVQ